MATPDDTISKIIAQPKNHDIKPEYLKIARRLQAAASKNHPEGVAAVQIKAVLHGDRVIFWTVEELKRIEPISQANFIVDFLVSNNL